MGHGRGHGRVHVLSSLTHLVAYTQIKLDLLKNLENWSPGVSPADIGVIYVSDTQII